MIYFGNRQVGKTHIAITNVAEAYLKEKGKVQVIAPTFPEANRFADMLVRRGVDKADIIFDKRLSDKLTDVVYKYRFIDGLDRIIGDDETTFATVDNATLIVREDEQYKDFEREYKPINLKVVTNVPEFVSIYKREIENLESKIKFLESEVERLKK